MGTEWNTETEQSSYRVTKLRVIYIVYSLGLLVNVHSYGCVCSKVSFSNKWHMHVIYVACTYIHNLLLCVWLTEPLCKVGRVVRISPRCAILIAAEVTVTPVVVLYINCRASVAALVVHGSSKNILFLSLYT